MENIIDSILSEREKQIALDVIDCLRRADMTTEALELLSRRFAIRSKVIADWYYSIRRQEDESEISVVGMGSQE